MKKLPSNFYITNQHEDASQEDQEDDGLMFEEATD
jgi:hypothetical protein